ncbi:MAG: mcpA 1 [Firmicutes bacterium]|nr:mcpA 1 [Bacillota bacterium]
MKSLRARLTAVTVILFVIGLCFLAGLNYWQADNLIQENIEAEMTAQATGVARQMAMTIGTSKTELSTISRSPIFASGDRNAIGAYLGMESNNNKEQYEAIVWADSQGNYVDGFGGGGNVAETPFFQRAVKGETLVFGPDIAAKTGNTVVIIAMPVKMGQKITGVLFGVVNINAVGKIIDEQKIGETGYSYVVRDDGMTIFHKDKSSINKVNPLQDPSFSADVKAAITKALQGDTSVSRYSYAGATKYFAGAPVEGTNWTVCITVPVREVSAKLGIFTRTSLITIVVVLFILIPAIYLLLTRMTKPLSTLEQVANQIAQGDLSITRIAVESQDELGRLARAFEVMSANLRSLVAHIGTSSEQVSASSEELSASAEQSSLAANQVAVSIISAAQGAEEQVGSVENALKLVQKISAEAQADSIKTRNAVDMVDQALSSATEGNKAVSLAIAQMNSISLTVNNSAQVVAELGERSKEIGQIVETISGIAGQTNLLALNAAIEAARAGEQGKGFAVVAEEVRKLAEQSQQAAKQIAELINDIQGKTDKAVDAMNNGTVEVSRGTEIVDQAGTSFAHIDAQLKEAALIAQQAADAMEHQVALSQEVLSGMDKIDAISTDISEQMQTVSAATEEQNASMEEIAASSQHLSRLADQLKDAVHQFKLK